MRLRMMHAVVCSLLTIIRASTARQPAAVSLPSTLLFVTGIARNTGSCFLVTGERACCQCGGATAAAASAAALALQGELDLVLEAEAKPPS